MKKETGLGLQTGRRKLDPQGDSQLPASPQLALRTAGHQNVGHLITGPVRPQGWQARGLVVGCPSFSRAPLGMPPRQWLACGSAQPFVSHLLRLYALTVIFYFQVNLSPFPEHASL